MMYLKYGVLLNLRNLSFTIPLKRKGSSIMKLKIIIEVDANMEEIRTIKKELGPFVRSRDARMKINLPISGPTSLNVPKIYTGDKPWGKSRG